MPSYGDMQARIANELARSDLGAEIRLAILSAISHHERRRFAFNEAVGTFSTVIGQEYYAAANFADIPTMAAVDSLRLLIGGSWEPLTRRTMAEMEDLAAGPVFTGDPSDFCLYAGQLRLSPIPNAVRTLRISYVRKLPALAANPDTNAWTEDGEELIRLRAKADVLENVIRDAESFAEADRLRRREGEVLAALLREAGNRAGSGQIRAHYL